MKHALRVMEHAIRGMQPPPGAQLRQPAPPHLAPLVELVGLLPAELLLALALAAAAALGVERREHLLRVAQVGRVAALEGREGRRLGLEGRDAPAPRAQAGVHGRVLGEGARHRRVPRGHRREHLREQQGMVGRGEQQGMVGRMHVRVHTPRGAAAKAREG